MRVAIDNGNGMRCDKCGCIVRPKSKNMVKVQCNVPHKDDNKASTGYYVTIKRVDLCRNCYNILFNNLGQITEKGSDYGFHS